MSLLNSSLSNIQKRFLLIIDNIEEPRFVTELSPSVGHILYTSKHNDWLKKIDIDVLKREESVALLLKLTGFDIVDSDAALLAETLGDLPLALAQAAAYIKQQKLTNFASYLAIYQENQAELLRKKQIQPSVNGQYGRAAVVMTTWNTTIQKLSQGAQNLMGFCAYLEPSFILRKLFTPLENNEILIRELMAYSFIKASDDGETFSMHSLVQSVIREQQTMMQVSSCLQALTQLFIQSFQHAEDDTPLESEQKQLHLSSLREYIQNNIKAKKLPFYEICHNLLLLRMVDQRFIQKTLTDKFSTNTHEQSVTEELNAIPAHDRIHILELIQNNVGTIAHENLLGAVNTVLSIPREKRDFFFDCLKQLILNHMTPEEREQIMRLLSDVDWDKWEKFIEETQFIYEKFTDADTIYSYLFTFGGEEGFLKTMYMTDETDDKESEEQSESAYSGTKNSEEAQRAVQNEETQILNPSNLFEVLGIGNDLVETLAPFFVGKSLAENQQFIERMLPFFSDDMDETDKSHIVWGVAEMPQEERVAFLNKIGTIENLTGYQKFFIVTKLYYVNSTEAKLFLLDILIKTLELPVDPNVGFLVGAFSISEIVFMLTELFEENSF